MRCDKLLYADEFNSEGYPKNTRCLIGIILNDADPDFLEFRTAKHDYKLNRKYIISLNETDIEFKGRLP